MKTAILSALLLTGCAAQPQVMPTSPATYTQPVSQHNDCVEAVIMMNAFNSVARPMLQKCNAGNSGQCVRFGLFYREVQGQLNPNLITQCFEKAWLSPYHPQSVIFVSEAPKMGKLIDQFTRSLGK